METEKPFSNSKKYLLLVVLLFFGFAAGWTAAKKYPADQAIDNANESRQSGYRYISPLLDCNISGKSSLNKYIPFEAKTKQMIADNMIDKNPNVSLSVYFRNLNNGPWFAINETADFAPASLLKVPLMIAYLKLSEEDPEILSKNLTVKNMETDVLQIVKPEKKVEEGQAYATEELLKYMIKYSDNNATKLLLENIPEEKLNIVYTDLGINIPGVRTSNDIITVRDYASFFRILYNSAYLNKINSEKALEWLSQTEYLDGIVKGVQGNITVSHKFGEREEMQDGKFERQLHDCGIIYYEKYPYLLCVMTKGDNFKQLSTIISDVSKIVFDEIKQNYP
jgi:beta-lactamase class A